jgi:hypothetical protein
MSSTEISVAETNPLRQDKKRNINLDESETKSRKKARGA